MCCTIVTLENYLTSAKTLRERVSRIDEMIDMMLISYHTSLQDTSVNVSEYQLNDGQMIVKTVYKNSSDVMGGIKGLETLKQTYLNQLHGRVMTARDISKLKRGR